MVRRPLKRNHTFSRNLRDLWPSRFSSQRHLAQTMGVHETQISHWLNEGLVPDYEWLLKLSQALGVTVNRLFSEEAPPEEIPALEISPNLLGLMHANLLGLIYDWQALPRDRQVLLEQLANFLRVAPPGLVAILNTTQRAIENRARTANNLQAKAPDPPANTRRRGPNSDRLDC